MQTPPLDGLHVLVLEDEFLIAMDLEQLCRDHGAANVTISRSLDGLSEPRFDAAIVDLRLGGVSTLDFAQRLAGDGIPFVFATGYGPTEELVARFPDISVVTKPYVGDELVIALAGAVSNRRARTAEVGG